MWALNTSVFSFFADFFVCDSSFFFSCHVSIVVVLLRCALCLLR